MVNPGQKKEVMFTFKIVIVGGPGVGKTCLFNRFCFNSFSFDSSMTIGINFHSINLKIKTKDEDHIIGEKFIVDSIFDMAGNKRFEPLTSKFLNGANGALLVFDLVDVDSFGHLDYWLEQLQTHADGSSIPIILVGNKSDLVTDELKEGVIANTEIKEYVRDNNLRAYYQTSALENQYVLDVFKALTNLMLSDQDAPYEVI